jgi:hypothetical protein
MIQALALLIAAMNLLTAVQANPNVTPQFKDMAMQTANFAISVAQEQLKATTTPQVVSAPQIAPQSVTAPVPEAIAPSVGAVVETPRLIIPNPLDDVVMTKTIYTGTDAEGRKWVSWGMQFSGSVNHSGKIRISLVTSEQTFEQDFLIRVNPTRFGGAFYKNGTYSVTLSETNPQGTFTRTWPIVITELDK